MSLRNVLGVLEDGEDQLWSTFEAAVALADREQARLTLAKTREVDHLFLWCGPFAAGGVYVPPSEDPAVTAGRLLARAAEFVPMEIPVTTRLLGIETERDLRRLVASGAYDVVVADRKRLARCRRMRRACRRDGVELVAVAATPHARPDAPPVPVALSLTR